MALQVWLPLNGDLTNNGLTNANITNSNATISNDGKIGKCYSFNGNSQKLTSTLPLAISSSIGTLACWIKFNAFPASGKWMCLMQLGTSGGFAACRLGVYMEYTNGINICIDGSTTAENLYTHSLSTNTWYHLCATNDGTNVKLYLNGEVVLSKIATKGTYTTSAPNLYIGGTNNYYLNGCLNDIRYYDTCLSAKEVEILARGLVLHYPMTGGGRGGDNLAKESRLLDTTPTKTNTNIGTYSRSTRIARTDGFYEAKCTGNWQGIGIFANSLNLAVGDKITYSFYTYIYGSSHNISFYPMMYNSSGTRDTTTSFPISVDGSTFQTANSRSIATITSSTPELHYVTFEWNSAVKSIIDNGGFILLSIQAHAGTWTDGSYTCIYKPKLECGSKPTPWMPNSADTLYSSMGYNDNIEYDVSGYNYHGTKIGLPTYSSDTPKYSISTSFNGVDDCIQVPLNTFFPNAGSFTINLWFKKSELGSKNYETVFGGISGFEMDTRNNSSTTLSYYVTGNSRGLTVQSPLNFDTWYMLTIVCDGTNELYYLNGEYKKQIAKKGMPTGNYFIGAWNSATQQNFKGLISDFRVYATALTATQVAELYNTAVSLSNNGTLMGYELIEN